MMQAISLSGAVVWTCIRRRSWRAFWSARLGRNRIRRCGHFAPSRGTLKRCGTGCGQRESRALGWRARASCRFDHMRPGGTFRADRRQRPRLDISQRGDARPMWRIPSGSPICVRHGLDRQELLCRPGR